MKAFVVVLALLAAANAASTGPNIDSMVVFEDSLKSRFDFSHLHLSHGEAPISTAPAVIASKNSINDRLIALLESFRPLFETGTDNIRPLDPFLHEGTGPHRVEYKNVVRADITVEDIDVRGLKEFIIDNLHVAIIGLRVDFAFTIPEVIYNSHYNIDARVGWLLKFRPSGNARVVAKNVLAVGQANLGTHNGHLVLRALELDFDVETTDLDIEGLLGNGLINTTLNWILNQISDSFIQDQRERVSAAVSELVFDIVNDILQKFTLLDLINGRD